ncbi:hypothetical protein JOD55_001598 [Arcanobacterium pluranimalium]|uniref:DUF2505 domain-containing protein n=1 Tax=Arcanobacterium pluranimalium TaxID=108028 RepID=UPI001959BA5B|nr:DUF2505 domain-containing protein [Arcanobacterium pluranimalium]MBM7825771.1 hypothetical protein [Arcanobacterium pluranimalium]
MKFSVVTHIDADISRVLDVLPSVELANARAQQLGLEQFTFTNSLEASARPHCDEVSSNLHATISPAKFAPQMRTLLPSGLDVTIAAHQVPAGTSATVHYDVVIKGAPVQVEIVAKILNDDAGTSVTHVGDVKVNVPFLGAGIEKKVLAQLPKIFERDARIIEDTVKTFKAN